MSLSEVLDRHLQAIQNPPVYGATFSQPKTGPDAPTAKQVSYYQALVERKQLSEDQRKALRSALSCFDRRSITSTIQWLIGLPWQPRPSLLTPPSPPSSAVASIQQGRYAVVHPTSGDLRFYSVRKPKDGKWAGFTFLAQLSGENQISIRDKQERDLVYAAIAKDVTGAMKLYGQKIGQCGHCRKQLTDAVSREFGIGPVCRKALGI